MKEKLEYENPEIQDLEDLHFANATVEATSQQETPDTPQPGDE